MENSLRIISDDFIAPQASAADRGAAQVERILEAALTCVSRLGFEKARIEDIVSEAGVSRATVYRRFSTKEQILEALLVRQAQPFVEQSRSIAIGPGSFQHRLRTFLCVSLRELSQMTWLKATLNGGVSPASFAVMATAQGTVASQVLLPFLSAGVASGDIRPGLRVNEASTWILRQMLGWGAGAELTPDEIVRLVSTYILPVLTPDAALSGFADNDFEARLSRLETKLGGVQGTRAAGAVGDI